MSVDLNSTVGPVLDGVIALFPTLLSLILGALPIIISMAVLGFVLGLFDSIIGKLKM